MRATGFKKNGGSELKVGLGRYAMAIPGQIHKEKLAAAAGSAVLGLGALSSRTSCSSSEVRIGRSRSSSRFRRIVPSIVALSTNIIFFGNAAGEHDCARLDDELIECPVPEAPLATELAEGYVLLEFTVLNDGSVVDIVVVEQKGDPRWVNAAVGALQRYRFKKSANPQRKTMPFTFVFE